MNRVFLLLLIISFSLNVYAQKQYEELKYPKLGEIELPDIERVELDNGMILFLIEDDELPLIQMTSIFGVGSIYEPADKIGLAAITGSVMRTGGSESMSGDEMNEVLESIASSVETSIGLTTGSASLSTLKENLDTTLPLFADVLMHPAFPEDKIQLEKIQEMSNISRRNDTPGEITSREFQKLIYGNESPFARHTEYATVNSITRDDLVSFHKKYIHPNNMMLGIWGDFDTQEMIAKIKETFQDWKKNPDFKKPEMPTVEYTYESSVHLIEKPDINQTNIRMGHLGGLRNNPDYADLIVMNTILGSGFSSRLVKNIRSRQGLAYSVGGGYGFNYSIPGVFYLVCMTKGESTVKAIESMIKEVELMKTELVTDEELSLAKDSYLNSFVFDFDDTGEVLQRAMIYEYFGYPADFLQQTKEKIEAVDKEDILRVAKKYLQHDKMKILAVGNSELFDKPLTELGVVNEIDITIPAPPGQGQ